VRSLWYCAADDSSGLRSSAYTRRGSGCSGGQLLNVRSTCSKARQDIGDYTPLLSYRMANRTRDVLRMNSAEAALQLGAVDSSFPLCIQPYTAVVCQPAPFGCFQ
jgi:hypothetical protein